MVHQRARNLPTKGVVVKWLFSNDTIAFGEDFAQVKLDDGSDFVVKSNYNGVIVKTVKLNTPVKNGSILANLVVGEKEIRKYKNRFFSKDNMELENNEYMPDDYDETNSTAYNGTDDENYSRAELSDSVRQQETPLVADVREEKMANQSMDRFAQMRANIKKSIENAPQLQNQSKISDEELLKMNNEYLLNQEGAQIFTKRDGVGPSKFRQLVNARKAALMEENNFKEVDEATEFNAMSRTDEKGRPLIMRNIIAARMEKLNEAGGDVSVLAENNDGQPLRGGEPGMPNNNNNNNDMSGFMKTQQSRASNVDTADMEIGDYRGTVMPGKDPNQLMGEIQNKTNKTYAESKLTNLYDASKRSSIIAKGNERNIILQRKQAVEAGLQETGQAQDLAFWKGNVPKEFTKIVPYQNPNGQIEYLPYNKTPKGRSEFNDWIRNNQKVKMPETSNLDVTQEWDTQHETPPQVQQTLSKKIHEQEDEFKAVAGSAVADESINLLKKQIADLQVSLEKQNQLNAATQRLNAAPTFGGNYAGGTDTFSQLVQYMLMQNIMQNMPTTKNSTEDVKDIIRREMDSFKNDLRPRHHNHSCNQNQCYCQGQNNQQFCGCQSGFFQPECSYHGGHNFYQPQMAQPHFQPMQSQMPYQAPMQPQQPQVQPQMAQPEPVVNYEEPKVEPKPEPELKLEPNVEAQQHPDDLKPINFEEEACIDEASYFGFEDNDKNKVVTREKINQNRNAAVKSMILSQNYIPPLTISTEVDMSSILKLKHVLKKTQDEIKFPSIAFIAKAISITLDEYPKLNSSYDPESNEVIIKKYHNIGLATETSEGLIIPVLKFVEKLSVKELAIDIKEMTQRLRTGELYNYETEGSTITIANYGNVGAIQATPTIFYPNAAVIGVGKVIKKPVVVSDEKLAIKAIMNMTLTVDQRIIDAAEAGRFLARVKKILEKPELLTVS